MNKFKILLVVTLLLGGTGVAAQTAAPLKLATKYEMPAAVKGRFDHLGIDLGGNRLFVVGEEAAQVLVFDMTTGKFVRAIKVDHPHAVLYREDLGRLYITDEGKGVLNIYDGKTYQLLKAVVLKVDTEANPELSARFQVRGIPNFVVLSGGRTIFQQAGLVRHEQMEQWLKSAA